MFKNQKVGFKKKILRLYPSICPRKDNIWCSCSLDFACYLKCRVNIFHLEILLSSRGDLFRFYKIFYSICHNQGFLLGIFANFQELIVVVVALHLGRQNNFSLALSGL